MSPNVHSLGSTSSGRGEESFMSSESMDNPYYISSAEETVNFEVGLTRGEHGLASIAGERFHVFKGDESSGEYTPGIGAMVEVPTDNSNSCLAGDDVKHIHLIHDRSPPASLQRMKQPRLETTIQGVNATGIACCRRDSNDSSDKCRGHGANEIETQPQDSSNTKCQCPSFQGDNYIMNTRKNILDNNVGMQCIHTKASCSQAPQCPCQGQPQCACSKQQVLATESPFQPQCCCHGFPISRCSNEQQQEYCSQQPLQQHSKQQRQHLSHVPQQCNNQEREKNGAKHKKMPDHTAAINSHSSGRVCFDFLPS